MKVVFVSNYFNHHQQDFCDEMNRLIGDKFTFIATSEMREERKRLGYELNQIPAYVKESYVSEDSMSYCNKLINDADVVIAGSAPETMLKQRIKDNKLTFRYQERLFKKRLNFIKFIFNAYTWYRRNPKNKNINLLCASGFTSADYGRLGLFKDNAYKWGYFPRTCNYDVNELLAKKDKTKILWCGRFIPYKHPEYAISLAEKLKNEGYDFVIDFIGTGELEGMLKAQVKELDLENYVVFHGAKKPQEVRRFMDESAIFLFTSNFEEGWGAVLNEAMNSGCAVVASHAIGSVPFMIKHRNNGLIFKNENIEDLFKQVKYLLDNPKEQIHIGENAYRTITELWNAKVAAERFLNLVEQINSNGYCDLYDNGPCSKASKIPNSWFKGD